MRVKGLLYKVFEFKIDRSLYKQQMQKIIESQPNLRTFQDTVDDVILRGDKITGVVTRIGLKLSAKVVILTAGTFLNGVVHIGSNHYSAGRMGASPSISLADNLRKLHLNVARLKTGTPPRLDRRSINFSNLEKQTSDLYAAPLSFLSTESNNRPKQIDCFITRTQPKTHDIILNHLHESAIYSGNIQGVGPRYCPSIEDKVKRFTDRTSHQIFLEPEGLHAYEIYPNGISTSLPYEVQEAFVRSIPGLEHVNITRPGYAIEYDSFDPQDLRPTLETKQIENLFIAGQINRTTGYEEAAAQGVYVGINAARKVQGQSEWVPKRHEAYIGVMNDDLITCGTNEPYRMFTSRAEYRLLLRPDNADHRLTPIGRELGCVSDQRWQVFLKKQKDMAAALDYVKRTRVTLTADQQKIFKEKFNQALTPGLTIFQLLQRPTLRYAFLEKLLTLSPIADDIRYSVEIEARYEGYIARQKIEINRLKKDEGTVIPSTFNYDSIPSLSNEIRQKLKKIKPGSIAVAGRIPGVTPAALSVLRVYLKRHTEKIDCMW
jgi:tRNA uridine 5-carboxymethylaminomethyl modification enzyme